MPKRHHKSGERAQQNENSRQSDQQAEQKERGGPGKADQQRGAGIGGSQGQDRASPRERQERTDRSSGTADVERGTQSGTSESMVNDMTGAFKERP